MSSTRDRSLFKHWNTDKTYKDKYYDSDMGKCNIYFNNNNILEKINLKLKQSQKYYTLKNKTILDTDIIFVTKFSEIKRSDKGGIYIIFNDGVNCLKLLIGWTGNDGSLYCISVFSLENNIHNDINHEFTSYQKKYKRTVQLSQPLINIINDIKLNKALQDNMPF